MIMTYEFIKRKLFTVSPAIDSHDKSDDLMQKAENRPKGL